MDSADLASMSLWLILLAIMLVGVVLLGVIVMRLKLLVRALKEAIEIVISLLNRILNELDSLAGGGTAPSSLPTSFAITQIASASSQGDPMSTPTPTILGITLGNTGTFQEVVTAPAGAAFPTGTTFTWTSSDPLTTLTPSADTTGVAVATSASDTATSFVLTCTSSFTPTGASAPLSATATVPLNAAVPPPATTPTAMAINQLS